MYENKREIIKRIDLEKVRESNKKYNEDVW